jgi:hypothetical protein
MPRDANFSGCFPGLSAGFKVIAYFCGCFAELAISSRTPISLHRATSISAIQRYRSGRHVVYSWRSRSSKKQALGSLGSGNNGIAVFAADGSAES